MCKKFLRSCPHESLDYNIWSQKKRFFPYTQQEQQSLIAFGAKFSMHIMLGSCVPNLRRRGWVEHTQMHLAIEERYTNLFISYTSNSWGTFSEFTFALDKNPNDGYEGGGGIC
jgi:hypothetical protein